ncbi:MAG TPA: hypothetical protein VF474_16435 [Phenylobacterium sp.]
MKCAETDCPHAATHVPQLFVPAMGWPQEEARAIKMILGAPMCRRHCERFTVADLMDVPNETGATLRDTLIPAVARMSGSPIPPDCDRAWVTPLRMNSDAYREFERAQRAGWRP